MKNPIKIASQNGFALIVTLSLMILLTVIAVGLLSLSAVSLRSSSAGEPMLRARANAKIGVMLAIAELQRTAGDDRRITADGAILGANVQHPNAVGVWTSWSPKLAEDPEAAAPDYASPKNSGFLGWLVSSDSPSDLKNRDWVTSGQHSKPVNLFSLSKDGFNLSGSKVNIMVGKPTAGAFAWAVSQEATKAKINVAGPESAQLVASNDVLQAQPRPSLAISDYLKNPPKDWNKRAARLITSSQTKLDTDIWKDSGSILGGAHFTTQSVGLITNVVKGGFKTDMSLGFELSDALFQGERLSEDSSPPKPSDPLNPFHAGAAPVAVPSSYQGQRPLFKPLQADSVYTVRLSFDPANVAFRFPVAAVPTFHTLRSFYRTPYHLYNTPDGVTAYERGNNHITITAPSATAPAGSHYPPSSAPNGGATVAGIRPVVDRVMFIVSAGLNLASFPPNRVEVVFTPIVTLWNPYNVALDIEGAVAYPWIDIPYSVSWGYNGEPPGGDHYFSGRMGQQFASKNHGRSVDPYFYALMTSDGLKPGASGNVPIRFQPGEVRVFAPATNVNKPFDKAGDVLSRTVFLKPLTDLSQLSTKGGLMVDIGGRQLQSTERVSVKLDAPDGNWPFYMSLEDAARFKVATPTNQGVRGEAIVDVLTQNFARSGTTTSITSQSFQFAALSQRPQAIGVIEVYHRVAKAAAGAAIADIVFTGNPRQPWMNDYISGASFNSGPQYLTRMRGLSSSAGDGLLQTANGGRNAFYGASHGPNTTHLTFFEIPREPLLSLAAFQHVDLSATPFASANQFANSWASAYVPRNKVSHTPSGKPSQFDYSLLANEALWDGFFFSGAAPEVSPRTGQQDATVWNSPNGASRPLDAVVKGFVSDHENLRNPRMRLDKGGKRDSELIADLISPQGCLKIAAHLKFDGAFNVNSTSIEAWKSFLSGLRGQSFQVENGESAGSTDTAFPRLRHPHGKPNDSWKGFRTLSDSGVKGLATAIVAEVRSRGPFLSLGEFVNRRVSGDALGLKGALQAAIDGSGLNQAALFDAFPTDSYPSESKSNIDPANTGVGTPGYLTQADLLQSIAPVITVRSDTFTLRGYGEARDAKGNLLASTCCEAVVQRNPAFADPSDKPDSAIDSLNQTNQLFGRRFSIISFRYLSPSELSI